MRLFPRTRFTGRRSRVAAFATVLALAGGGFGLASATETTGTVTACATATTPAHTVAVDGTNVATIPGDTATHCETTTYTVPTVTETVTTSGSSFTPIRVNAGGSTFTDAAGNAWAADADFSGGSTATATGAVSGTTDDSLYQTERYSTTSFSYVFTGIPAGDYNVNLKFDEGFGFAAGARKFNVSIQGTQVLTNFDVAAEVGQNAADDKSFVATVAADGQLTVAFSKGAADNPLVAAIEVTAANPSPPPAGADPSGVAMPTGDVTGWHQVFADNFPSGEDVALGAYCGDPNGFPKNAATAAKWTAYPYTWQSSWTASGSAGTPTWAHYCPERTTSIHDGVMDFWLHTETDPNAGLLHEISAPLPIIPGATSVNSQASGRYVVRYEIPVSFPMFHLSWLLWPNSNNWPTDGEIDFPEADTNSNTVSAFMHRQDGTSGGDQDAYSGSAPIGTWHTAEIDWTPTSTKFILDGVTLGNSTSRIPNTLMHYILQNGGDPGVSTPDNTSQGHVLVDWVTIYAPS